MKNKKVIGITTGVIILIGALLVIAGLIYRNHLLHEYNINKTQVVSKLRISNGFITEKDGIYTYTVSVANPTKRDIKLKYLVFTFYNKDNEKMVKVIGYADEVIRSNEAISVSGAVDRNIKKANRVEIEVVK
ncbi:MAG: hypothetical protein J5892_03600 [Bacilli bacterium]|nr:hypothetical protein [Bacilli bacterium]